MITPRLRKKVLRSCRRILEDHLRIIARCSKRDKPKKLRALQASPLECSPEDCYWFLRAWLRRRIPDQEAVAIRIACHEEQFRTYIEDDSEMLQFDLDKLKTIGVQLVSYFAGVFCPAVAHLGEYRLAVETANSLKTRFTGSHHRKVLGAGSEGNIEEELMRHVLLGPAIRSLAVFYPGGLTS